MKTNELPKIELQCDDDAWVEQPRTGDEVVVVIEGSSLFNYYYVHCVWVDDRRQWICNHIEHKYYEAAHTGQELDVDSTQYQLNQQYGAKIREAYNVVPEKISTGDVLSTPPSKLRQIALRP
jgi:hypothetical protein